jgi:hypothetical protein
LDARIAGRGAVDIGDWFVGVAHGEPDRGTATTGFERGAGAYGAGCTKDDDFWAGRCHCVMFCMLERQKGTDTVCR